ncbi:MAG: hypothetical protein ACXW28_01255 [Thermoanaerobaculia bacterium]
MDVEVHRRAGREKGNGQRHERASHVADRDQDDGHEIRQPPEVELRDLRERLQHDRERRPVDRHLRAAVHVEQIVPEHERHPRGEQQRSRRDDEERALRFALYEEDREEDGDGEGRPFELREDRARHAEGGEEGLRALVVDERERADGDGLEQQQHRLRTAGGIGEGECVGERGRDEERAGIVTTPSADDGQQREEE